jgi:predicted aldo/keto reductase-like oxidoreductase
MVTIDGKNTVDQDKVDQMLKRGYELGINYFDTAYLYNDGQSEIAVGRAVKSFRKDILVSSKSPSHLIKKPGDYRRILEEQLKKLDMDYIDFYHFHGIRYESFLSIDKNANWLKEAQQAKEEGLIKHISFSCHDKPENMIKLIDMGCFESVLCQYSAIDRSNEEAIAYAKAKGLGTVVMGPLGGGRVSGLPKEIAQQLGLKVKSSVEMAFRFVFANSNINCALSGMENLKMVEENCEISLNGEPLSAEEVQAVNDLMAENKRLSELYCTDAPTAFPAPRVSISLKSSR